MKTVIEWHKGKPEKSGWYLTLMYHGSFETLRYSAKHGKWNASDWLDKAEHAFKDEEIYAWADVGKTEIKVTKWAKDDNAGN